MSISYRFESNIVFLELAGEYSTAELGQLIIDSLDDPLSPDRPDMLFDLSASRSIRQRSTEDIKQMVQLFATLVGRVGKRIAFYAPSDLPYGLMRMGTMLAGESERSAQVFRTRDEALQWLRSSTF
jgi:hypothetical protein